MVGLANTPDIPNWKRIPEKKFIQLVKNSNICCLFFYVPYAIVTIYVILFIQNISPFLMGSNPMANSS